MAVRKTEFTYMSADRKTPIHALLWEPETQVCGVLQIAHGMQEYIERYDDFACFLCSKGLAVCANDHLGHGGSVLSDEQFGYFAEENGNKAVLSDMRELQRLVQGKYPDVPYFILGHSMGSFLARQYLCMHGKSLDGAVISGTAWHSAAEADAGMKLCSLIARSKGWRHRSPLVTKIAMGSYNKRFEPARTKSDWLTRDEAIVDAYRKDRRTQFTFTLNGYYNMFVSLKYLTEPKNLKKVPTDLPILFISGEMDPVGNFGLGVKKAVLSLQGAGCRKISCRFYPNDRHEVLNELDRQQVYDDVWKFLRPLTAVN